VRKKKKACSNFNFFIYLAWQEKREFIKSGTNLAVIIKGCRIRSLKFKEVNPYVIKGKKP
jgi:hypothetical protein